MLEVNLLGTGGMVPLPGRFLTSLLVRYEGTAILIDCGEGTQVAIREQGLGFKQIAVICLTHFHADHVAGLPGLLLTIGNAGRADPLMIVGPAHVGEVVQCLCVIAPQLPYELRFAEIGKEGGELLTLEDLTLSAHPVEHWIPCYAYRLDLSRKPRFDAAKAKALEIPKRFLSLLQRGETVETEGRTFAPDAVMGEARRGLRMTYATDLRPADSLAEFARDSDLFICEGMYGDPEKMEKAVEHRHCMFSEAAEMAKKAAARELWLTHFSPAMPDPQTHLEEAARIFPRVFLDKHSDVLRFRD